MDSYWPISDILTFSEDPKPKLVNHKYFSLLFPVPAVSINNLIFISIACVNTVIIELIQSAPNLEIVTASKIGLYHPFIVIDGCAMPTDYFRA